jgi:hypothetical protein
MGLWDELCLICGLAQGGGPGRLFGILEDCLEKIIEDIRKQKLELNLTENQLRDEIQKILLLFQPEDYRNDSDYERGVVEGSLPSPSYFPFSFEKWDGWEAIAIGIFDESQDVPSRIDGFVSYILSGISSHDIPSGYYHSPCDISFWIRWPF